ncbi:MAG: transaldolase [Microthrixaceae bacterium]|nr:transaldolase [Acidimicrobiales bacterium]MCB9405081.1 transaldolase [Microthrixaceae bacterium]
MTRLHVLHESGGQSPWLDNLRRDWLRNGEVARWVERGVRGITSNPAIFQKAFTATTAYEDQFRALVDDGRSTEDAYWDLVTADIVEACDLLEPLSSASGRADGQVSVEVSPSLAHDTQGTLDAARELNRRIDRPNLYVKIPATSEGIPAIRAAISEGINVNVTLLFSLTRYAEVIEAYLGGLEDADGPLVGRSGVASFFVSRVDNEVDRLLTEIGTEKALSLRGRAAVANAQLAYALYLDRFSGERWESLSKAGALPQRPLWASTSTKNPDYPATLYVDTLIAPGTVNTMPEATLAAFEAEGTVARSADADLDGARRVLDDLASVGIDLDAVTDRLETEGINAFVESFDDLLRTLDQGVIPDLVADGR